MKKVLFPLFLIAGLSSATHASVIVGTDVGYLLDRQEAYVTARVGLELQRTDSVSHQLALEVGYTETKTAGAEANLLPVTLNYRLAGETAGPWAYYAGLGAGLARTSVDGVSTGGSVRLRDESFAAQAFAGIEYRLTQVAAVTAGLRYLWIDDVTLASGDYEIGDDVAVSVGFRLRF